MRAFIDSSSRGEDGETGINGVRRRTLFPTRTPFTKLYINQVDMPLSPYSTLRSGSPLFAPAGSQAYQRLPPVDSRNDLVFSRGQNGATKELTSPSIDGIGNDLVHVVDLSAASDSAGGYVIEAEGNEDIVRSFEHANRDDTSDVLPSLHVLLSAPADSSLDSAHWQSKAKSVDEDGTEKKSRHDIPLPAFIPLVEAYINFNPAGAQYVRITPETKGTNHPSHPR